jgi:hypothetical protein
MVFYDQMGCRENLGPTRGALDEGKLIPLSPRDNKKHDDRSYATPRTLSHLHSNESVCKFYQTERKSPSPLPFSNPIEPKKEFREMWHSLQTPPVHSLPSELQEAGLTSSTSAALKPQQTTRKSKKKGGKGGKVKITNTHLKDLGIDLSKDYVPNKK